MVGRGSVRERNVTYAPVASGPVCFRFDSVAVLSRGLVWWILLKRRLDSLVRMGFDFFLYEDTGEEDLYRNYSNGTEEDFPGH